MHANGCDDLYQLEIRRDRGALSSPTGDPAVGCARALMPAILLREERRNKAVYTHKNGVIPAWPEVPAGSHLAPLEVWLSPVGETSSKQNQTMQTPQKKTRSLLAGCTLWAACNR